MNGTDTNERLQTEFRRTYFASAERVEPETLAAQVHGMAKTPLVQALLNAVDGFVLVLNQQRQVLAANRSVLEAVGVDSVECVIGDRPGEVFNCASASLGPGGCGTSPACSTCGATIAILASQVSEKPRVGECLLTVNSNGRSKPAEYRVKCTPVEIEGEPLTILALTDISAEKRRDALESFFLHDLMNTIGGLMGWSELLSLIGPTTSKEAATKIFAITQRLAREVRDHRMLLLAEKGDLEAVIKPVLVSDLLQSLSLVFEENPLLEERELVVDRVEPGLVVRTDEALLVRVLTNLTKNALEAVKSDGFVRVYFEIREDRPVFSVWNPGQIPKHIAMQIFKRSFSTKGEKGRGLGTYACRVFVEDYLGGRVSFVSTQDKGTTFTVELR